MHVTATAVGSPHRTLPRARRPPVLCLLLHLPSWPCVGRRLLAPVAAGCGAVWGWQLARSSAALGVRRCGHQQLHPRSLSIISALSPADPYISCNQKISGLSAQCDRSLSSRPADQTAARAEQSSTSTSSTRPLGWVPPNNRTTVQLDLRRLSERCTHTHV
jgi:hypothetical protein